MKILESVGSCKIKIVERTGSTLVNTLHKSNNWADNDCLRDDCVICTSTVKGVKKGSCRRCNVTYETFCITCRKIVQKRSLENTVQDVDAVESNLETVVPPEAASTDCNNCLELHSSYMGLSRLFQEPGETEDILEE